MKHRTFVLVMAYEEHRKKTEPGFTNHLGREICLYFEVHIYTALGKLSNLNV